MLAIVLLLFWLLANIWWNTLSTLDTKCICSLGLWFVYFFWWRTRISVFCLQIFWDWQIFESHILPCVRSPPKTSLAARAPLQSQLSYLILFLGLLHMRHWQLIRSKLGFYISSGITLDIDVISLWRTSYWSIEDKKYKKLKEIPSRPFLENPLEKASMYACIHLKLIGNLQGFNQWQTC